MIKSFIAAFLLLTLAAKGQNGISFESNLTWAEVKQKAKIENKYIFMDCFATWCLPCKQMDKEVYPNDTIGAFVNSNFISIKIQMDTSTSDGDDVKKKYKEASSIQREFKVSAFPTFLFF